MCGFLIYPFKVRKDVLETHLTIQKHRGVDGFGAISLQPSQEGWRPRTKDLKVETFLKEYEQKIPRNHGAIIHHRKASIGGVKADLVHPLSNEGGKVHVMQNGTRRDLVRMFGEDSDTKALATYWDKVDDEVLWLMLDGCGVVFVMDRGRLFFHRDKGRTLYKCVEGKMAGMYASEPVSPGMWALVDEYVLEELPLSPAEWHLQHDKPVEYKVKECSYSTCRQPFIGGNTNYSCPECRNPATRSYTYGGKGVNNRGRGYQDTYAGFNPPGWRGRRGFV